MEGELSAALALAAAERWQLPESQTGLALGKMPPSASSPNAGLAATWGPRVGASRPLKVALRVELARQMLVQAAPPTARTSPVASTPAAVVRVTVLAVVKDAAEPFVAQVDVPVWAERPLAAGELAPALFTADLTRLLPAAAWDGPARIYVLAGRFIAGPLIPPA